MERVLRPGACSRGLVPSHSDGCEDASIVQVPLADGQLGWSLWCGPSARLLVSLAVPSHQVAQAARHLLECHAPGVHDETFDVLLCAITTCDQARDWLSPVVDAVLPIIAVAAAGC